MFSIMTLFVALTISAAPSLAERQAAEEAVQTDDPMQPCADEDIASAEDFTLP
jgi:hypothetical protein